MNLRERKKKETALVAQSEEYLLLEAVVAGLILVIIRVTRIVRGV